jgi:hypothetical protein
MKNQVFKAAVGAFGASLLVLMGAAGAAADDDENQSVEITAEIKPLVEPGMLALSVASNATSLTETSADPEEVREFTGTLPTVTVTDTRDPDDVDPAAWWYVVGQTTAFEGDGSQPDIPAANLGWAPELTGPNDGEGTVAAGPEVKTAEDTVAGPGLNDQVLLFWTGSSLDYIEEESWSATAGLVLKTSPLVAAGTYKSTLTLSLFE